MKFERLLAIVMLLINRKHINAKELAEHFEVSQRTIYRDIEAINQAGIPIVSYMGPEGGFGIMENYKINKNFLDENEINTILTALKSLNITMNNRRISNTMEKLSSMLSKRDYDSDYKSKFPINIDYSNWSSNNTDKDKLKMTLKDFSWYLHGYCHTKEDYRIFKVKRMFKVNLTSDTFTRNVAPIEVLDYHKEWNKGKPMLNIVLKFTPYVKARVVDYFNEEQIQFNEDGTTTVRFTFPQDDWLFELILGFGSQVEVLEPPQLRNIIRQKAVEMVNIYNMDK